MSAKRKVPSPTTIADVENLTLDHILMSVDVLGALIVFANTGYFGESRHNRANTIEDIKAARPCRMWRSNVVYPPGTWRLDPQEQEFQVLVRLDPQEVYVNDADRAQNWNGFSTYVEWAKQGYTPPPIYTQRHADGEHVAAHGSKRVLAARIAKCSLFSWHTECRPTATYSWWRCPDDLMQQALREMGVTSKQLTEGAYLYDDHTIPAFDPANPRPRPIETD